MRNPLACAIPIAFVLAACAGPPPETQSTSEAAAAVARRWIGSGDSDLDTVKYYVMAHVAADHLSKIQAAMADWAAETPIRWSYAGNETAIDIYDATPHVIIDETNQDLGLSGTFAYYDLSYASNSTAPTSSLGGEQRSWYAAHASIIRRAGIPTYGGPLPYDDLVVLLEKGGAIWTPSAGTNRLGQPFYHELLHQLGHVLGLSDEDGRPDYSCFLALCQNCRELDWYNEDFLVGGGDLLSDYDLTSVMQQPSTLHNGCYDFLYSPNAACELRDDTCTGTGAVLLGKNPISDDDANALFLMYPPVLGVDEPGDNYGAALATGDFDGDGYADLAVGAPGQSAGAGAVFLWRGTAKGLAPWKVLTVSGGQANDKFGTSLWAGTLDSSPSASLIVGAPGRAVFGVKMGAAYVYSPTATGPANPVQLAATGAFGWSTTSVGVAGDLEGQAVAAGRFQGLAGTQIVVGAPGSNRFHVYTPNGAGGYTKWKMYVHGGGANFGATIAIGDIDNDGRNDLAVADFNGSKVYAYFGDGAGLASGVEIDQPGGSVPGDDFGVSMTIGHFDANSATNHLVIGAFGRNDYKGSIFGYNGQKLKLGQMSYYGLNASAASGGFGWALATARFLPGAVDQLVVGQPWASPAGRIVYYTGRQTAGENLLTNIGQAIPWAYEQDPLNIGYKFGQVLVVGDFNRDGHPDVAVTEPGYRSTVGAVWALDGSADTTPQPRGFHFTMFLAQGTGTVQQRAQEYRH